MSYAVATPVYDGPFELLLHLILKEEVDLWDVSIAHVIEAFLVEVEGMDHLDLEAATEFLLIAATLVELKARRLLPGSEPTDLDEELMRFEERDLLLARLLECKTFKSASAVLEAALLAGKRVVARTAGPEEPFRSLAPDPLERVTLDALLGAARRALAPKELEFVDTYHVAPIRVSVRDAAEALLIALPAGRPVSFRELVRGIDSRLEMIVRFLAVLELLKQGMVDVAQSETFGDLTVRRLAEDERVLDMGSLDDWDEAPVRARRIEHSDEEDFDVDVGADMSVASVAD
ncbi:MAG: segregation/condensation protein A [Acidimicrobiia bacterium]|nr:segregation/condensation protein A [Acidimicrobiia bacterium]